jgi:hypothetical protein
MDVAWLIGVLCLVMIPLVLLLKQNNPKAAVVRAELICTSLEKLCIRVFPLMALMAELTLPAMAVSAQDYVTGPGSPPPISAGKRDQFWYSLT